MAAALHHFVARVVRDIVVFVLLEQVVGAHAIAVVQQALRRRQNKQTNTHIVNGGR